MSYTDELGLLLQAALRAGDIHLSGRPSPESIHHKQDRSPVTEVDRRCEALIRDILLTRYPRDGFMGEESGAVQGSSGRRWIVDPVDGTRPFIRGIPTHSVLIALEDEQELVCAAIHLPALKETYWAEKGIGAFCNGKPIHVSTTGSLNRAMGSGLGFVEQCEEKNGKKLFSLMKKWDYTYGFMDAYSYACVASGKIDACVNLLDKPWDCAAGACIVSEAGGRFSDIRGENTIFNDTIVLSNSVIHDQILEHFA
ncbi:MAG: inositol monophosphatase family protein [Fibrobacterota bacterium]